MTLAISKILCGVSLDDTTAPITSAIAWSHRLAAVTGSEFHLLGAIDPDSVERSPAYLSEVHRDAVAKLELSDAAVNEPETDKEVTIEPLVEALFVRASGGRADLVVTPSHTVEGTTQFGFNGIGHALAHRLDCPVAVVPRFGGVVRHGTYVVGIDGSEMSRLALEWTRQLAQLTGSHCCAVYSVEEFYGTFNASGWYGQDERDACDSVPKDGSVEYVGRVGRDPVDTLRAVAEERSAAAIIVAARQRHSLGGALLGRVPDHLLHQPTCPTLVLPHAMLQRETAAVGARHDRR